MRRSAHSRLREEELRILLFAGDLLAAVAASFATPVLWAQLDPEFAPRVDLRLWQVGFVVGWVLLLQLLGGSDIVRPRFGRRSIVAVTRTTAAALVAVLVLFYFAPFFAPRGSTLLTLPVAALVTLVWRYGYLRFLALQVLERRVALVGVDEAARRIARVIVDAPGATYYRVVAFLGAGDAPIGGVPVIRTDGDMWETVRDLGVDVLVVGHTRTLPDDMLAAFARCFDHGVEAVPATTLYEQLTGRVMVSALEADWYAELPTHTRGMYVLAKRAIDLIVATVGGLLTLALVPFIALAIRLESGGPILIRQIRIGQRGTTFVLHKFRSMRRDAEPDGQPHWATENDARVTSVGRFLRRTRLDELPQLWDVLVGNMSLIGPRPERPEFVDALARELPLYRARSLVRPGITGWAQVQYPYARSIEENLAKLEYDLYYVRHLSPLLDLAIALRTLLVIFRPRDFPATS